MSAAPISTTDEARPSEGQSFPTLKIDPSKLQPSDFYFGKCLGEGAFARVVHSKFKRNNHEFAIKIMEKRHIKRENKIKYVMMEKSILSKLNHPMVVKLFYTFQDQNYLYMCMEIAHGGELLQLIDQKCEESKARGVQNVAFEEHMARVYSAEILEAVRYLHNSDVIHRDLKPENILISASGHIKITDFGTALLTNSTDEMSRNSFVGTADYVSPEVLQDEDATPACDMWAVGCIIYQMLSGTSPFRAASEYLTFNIILGHCNGTDPLKYPNTFSESSKDIIGKLLSSDAATRLGAGPDGSDNDFENLKAHPFFAASDPSVRWGHLLEQPAPFTPDPSKFPDPSAMHDGADEDWLSDGEATPIEVNPAAYKKGSKVENEDSISSPPVQSSSILPFLLGRAGSLDVDLSPPTKLPSSGRYWDIYLQPGEQHVFGGIVWKRKGLFSKRRQLVLTNKPRLVYFDPETMQQKGEIPWSESFPVRCIQLSTSAFDILAESTGRRYHITDNEAGAQMWIDLINAMLQKQRDLVNGVKRVISEPEGEKRADPFDIPKSVEEAVGQHSRHYSSSVDNSVSGIASPSPVYFSMEVTGLVAAEVPPVSVEHSTIDEASDSIEVRIFEQSSSATHS